MTNYKRHVQRGEHHVTVLVAKQDIPAGTDGSDVADMLKPQSVPRRSVVPGAISSPDEISKRVATQTTYAGEQVSSRRFDSVSEAGVAGQLKGPLRAYQVMGDRNQLLAGTLKDNDHVDLVAADTFQPQNSGAGAHVSRVVLRDLKVLKAPEQPAAGSKLTGGIDQKFTALLAITDSQAQKFQWVLSVAGDSGSDGDTWHLALRPVVRATDSPDHLDSFWTVFLDGLRPAQRRALFR